MMGSMKHLLILPVLFFSMTCSNSSGFRPTCDTEGVGLKHVVKGTADTHGTEYHISISVDGTAMEAIADTGSSNLLVAHDAVTPTGPSLGSFSIAYGRGAADLQTYQGTVDLNCGPGVKGYRYGYIQPGSSETLTVMGLAYHSIEKFSGPNPPDHTFFEDLVLTQGISDEFSMQLCGMNNPNSKIYFGGVSSSIDSSQFQYVPVIEDKWYTIKASTIQTHDRKHSVPGTLGNVIVDSGTTLNLIPSAMLNDLVTYLSTTYPGAADWATIQANPGGVKVACPSAAQLASLPSIDIVLSDTVTLSIAPNTYFKSTDNGCYFGFAQQTDQTIILGQVTMENYYVHFDRKFISQGQIRGRIGFIPSAKRCNP